MVAASRLSVRKFERMRQLRAFCRVVEMKSITRAAAAVGLSQPAVSAQVQELEFEMQARLFERHGPHIALTPAGECLYELARPLVERLERIPVDLVERMDENISGELRIGAGAAAVIYILPSFAKRFQDEYPGIRLRIERILSDESYEVLQDGKVDFLFGFARAKDARFSFHPILASRLVLITPKDHPLAGRTSVGIQEISGDAAIVPPVGTFSRNLGESIARQFGAEINAAIETSGWGLIKTYVEAGFGISVIPSVCVSRTDRLSVIPIEELREVQDYGVFIRSDVPLAPPARRFLLMMDPEFPFL